jgi:hypothetical protein
LSGRRSDGPEAVFLLLACCYQEVAYDATKLRLHWGSLPFPWSQVAFELSRPALLALAALPVLAAALIINQAVHLRFLIRTAAINLALITFGHYLPDLCPWVNLPEAGNPYSRTLIFPPILLLFSNFLVSAWLGCPLPRRAPLHAAKAKAAIEQV